MPRPIEVHHAIPFEQAVAAATAYIHQEPGGQSFTDFFNAHNLEDPAAFEQFCDPLKAVVELDLVFDETPADAIEWLCVQYNLTDLLASARLDLAGPYTLGRTILLGEGVADPDIVPIIQRSKRLARQFGVVDNEVILDTCMIGLSEYRLTGEPFLEAKRDEQGRINELIVKPQVHAQYMLPYLRRWQGCPMVGQTVLSPYTGKRVNLYELYWEVAVAQQHAQRERKGLLNLDRVSPSDAASGISP